MTLETLVQALPAYLVWALVALNGLACVAYLIAGDTPRFFYFLGGTMLITATLFMK